MSAEGAKVVVSDLSLDRAEAVAARSERRRGDAMHIDVRSADLVERVVAGTVERFGRLDVSITARPTSTSSTRKTSG